MRKGELGVNDIYIDQNTKKIVIKLNGKVYSELPLTPDNLYYAYIYFTSKMKNISFEKAEYRIKNRHYNGGQKRKNQN